MRLLAIASIGLLGVGMLSPATAQDARPLYRVFLADGTALVSYGEWAKVDDRLVFSMPLTPAAGPSDLHLVSVPLQQVDLGKTESYADSVRAANYAARQGEADFAQLSTSVAQALNQVALIEDPVRRLAAAERGRESLVNWPGAQYGYRASEVAEIIGVLDGVISGLRTSAGKDQGGFALALSATTTVAREALLGAPSQTEVVQHLMAASALASSPAEKVSLLQTVIAIIDRAIDLLPASFAASVRATALRGIAEEKRVDSLYAKLRTGILANATKYASRAEVRRLERLRMRLRNEDKKLGSRRPDEVAAVLATLEAHLDAARRLRLAQDQWLERIERLRAYRRASANCLQTLNEARDSLDDIRMLAGPSPQRLRPLAPQLSSAGRRLALVNPPAELSATHAVFRSAFELAENAVRLRLDAAAHADVNLANQASAAASGALMLMGRGRADLEAAMQPPIGGRTVSSP